MDLSSSDNVMTMMDASHRPKNVDLALRPTDKTKYALKDGSMPAIHKGDSFLQEIQQGVVNASHRTVINL